jgi:glycogen debranching enzyme
MPIESPAITPSGIESLPEASFYIPATEPTMRLRRTMKRDDCFLVFDSHGDIGASPGGPDGLFNGDTRYLSHFELLINGLQPLLLGSNLSDDNCVLSVDLTNPDIYYDKRIILQKNLLHVARTVFVWRSTLFHRFVVRNFSADRVRLLLSITFDSDFADVFEVRGAQRARRGAVHSLVEGNGADFIYLGLDGKTRRTRIMFEPTPTHLSPSLASFQLDLEPHRSVSLFGTISCDSDRPEPPPPFLKSLRSAHRELKQMIRVGTEIDTSNQVFNEVLRRATADLAILLTHTPQGTYPYAGIPWYSTTFGRDGLITAMQCLWLDPRMALAVLKRLAAYQAADYDPESDAEPGKILHEMRAGEMAALHEVPFGLYYGSVDSTPLFVILAGRYAQTTGDLDTLRGLWPAIDRALAWIDGPGDRDHDGFVEYFKATPRGLSNQGWKDSYDAVFHADGRLAEGPIALAEVQGYVYAAKKLASWCADQLGFAERARQLDAEAAHLAERFEDAFWCEEIGTYALALDGDKQPCKVATSNAGQVLTSGIARGDRAERIAQQLMEPKFFSGWGVRTVAVDEARYNPMSYHNGSVWPHDNAMVATGLARYGDSRAATRIFQGMFDAATYMDLRRLPELFCGFPRFRGRGPTLYPVACAPQAWSSGAFFAMLQASLGIEQDPFANVIRFRNPKLPAFLESVVLRGLKAGTGSVDLSVRRHGEDKISLQIIEARGNIEVTASFSG